MTKNDIVYKIAIQTRTEKRKVEQIIDLFLDEIKESLIDGDKVILRDFISLDITQRPERQARHPRTGKMITNPPVKSIRCRVSKALRNAVNRR